MAQDRKIRKLIQILQGHFLANYNFFLNNCNCETIRLKMIEIARYHAAALKFILNITFTNSKTLSALQQYYLLLDALIEAHNAIQMLQLINHLLADDERKLTALLFSLGFLSSLAHRCRCLTDKGFVRIGKWFFKPHELEEKSLGNT